MEDTASRAIAIVGIGAVLPDAATAPAFWDNVKAGRYSISEVARERWDPDLYYDPDPRAPDKTYSRIGGFVRTYEWDPVKWKIGIPPRVAEAMDVAQKWAVAGTREALLSYGYPGRPLDLERTAVILGNAMAGERHYLTSLRISFPEFARELDAAPSFAALPKDVRARLSGELRASVDRDFPEITEDTMPGELSNCMAGRVANLFNFHGPNFVCDAACASAMAAMSAAVDGLVEGHFDAAVTGGIDRNMGASTYVKFSKIGALSATGTRPYADGADGFVMGEGAVIFLLKRLADAERAGDTVYAVLRGIGGASDGKGKGITAPNPVGQRFAMERAWRNAGLSPGTATLVEGHGTSTRVGDVVEVESLCAVFADGLPAGSIALGSVKSNIGHLKGAAGAAGLLKATYALHEKLLPPSLNFHAPNPDIDFAHSPFFVNTELREWPCPGDAVRRAGVSAFGFGGTNFHVVLEEYVPGRLKANGRGREAMGAGAKGSLARAAGPAGSPGAGATPKRPLRGALVLGAPDAATLAARLEAVQRDAAAGRAPSPAPPLEADLRAPERIAIDYEGAADLGEKAGKARRVLAAESPAAWKALRAQGVFRGRGPAAKVAFLYTGQGSQYVNMLRGLRETEPVVRDTFAEADGVMKPLLGRPLSDYLFVAADDPVALAQAEDGLKQTAITQPAVLTVDAALTRLLDAYGVRPDLVMGHSLGEYGALEAASVLPFADALEAVSARGREMTRVAVADNGKMAAVFAPLALIEEKLSSLGGDVVVANYNSRAQAVIGGASAAVDAAVQAFLADGINAIPLPVSHAFHTQIVAPASEPLRRVLERLRIEPPQVPVVANVTGELYPSGPGAREAILEVLGRQVASPVQFVKGLQTLYREGVRVFVEVGPKKALHGFVEDVFADDPEVSALFTNHPKLAEAVAFNQALCGLYAAGLGVGEVQVQESVGAPSPEPFSADRYRDLGHVFAEMLERGLAIYAGRTPAGPAAAEVREPVVITGAALGLPGLPRVFDDSNVARILRGEQFIDAVPNHLRRSMADKHIVRLVKSDGGESRFEHIETAADVIKLAARRGALDLESEFGVSKERIPALDTVTRLAIGAGIDALRDAGIPLVLRYKTTTRGTQLPDRFVLPESLRDDTGVIFASAFPGLDSFAEVITRYHTDRARRERLMELAELRRRLAAETTAVSVLAEVSARIQEVENALHQDPFVFDRRFLFRVLAMGHSQFAEIVGARGPNTHINAACASTTQAMAVAEDWIRAGRCRRVIVLSADDASSDNLMEWLGSGFLASGAAATDDVVAEAALPFDRRRHGMIVGMGAAALVVESAQAARERGLRPICEVLSAVTANSAFHGTRLDASHISQVMETLVSQAERQWGLKRREIAPETVFVSHETYTPARGGSASAEVHALRAVFGADAGRIVMANTKGFTGHPMGVGIEDVVAVKALETGLVPPVANFKEIDPELGSLNLSRGGAYPVSHALRLAAGFGSQISLSLLRWVPSPDGQRRRPEELGFAYRIADPAAWRQWLAALSGQEQPDLEVVQRTLRVRDHGAAQRAVAAAPAAASIASAPAPAPPPVAPVPVPAPAVAVLSSVAQADPAPDPIRQRILDLVATKTGYPPEMLALDLDLEADLGIDTVKQAELFAAVREEWGIPRDEKRRLRDYPTLSHVIGFVKSMRPDLAVAPSAPTSPPPAPVLPAVATSGTDPVADRVLALVTEKTGYPPDMLDLDLDLEADLGVDTVKQAELFASVRQLWDIPRDDKRKLRDYPTLRHVIAFVHAMRPDIGATTALEPVAGPPLAPPVPASLEAAYLVPRRVVVPVLRPPLALCKPTGVSLKKGLRVVVVADRAGVGKALVRRLEKLDVAVLVVEEPPETRALAKQVETWLAEGPIHGVYWLPALDPEGDLAALDLASWREALRVRVKLLYATMRALYDQVEARGTFLVAATRQGGQHGYDESGAQAPLGGGVAGFTKAYKRERPDALVKVVDFEWSRKTAELADLLVDETLRDPGVVEVGYKAGLRTTLALEEQDAADGRPGLTLGRETVFVVTGAAGSIVSAITADLAAASGGTFHLLDLVPEPDPRSPDLARFRTDREGLKRELFERMKALGQRATPATVEKELAGLERATAALQAIDAVKRAGGSVHYHQADLRDGEAIGKAMARVRETSGRVDVLLHAGGLETSRFLKDKEPAEFDLVFDVKADGWFNLMKGLGDAPLGAAVVFSSIAGRFGNGGQTDYASANDLLCKSVSAFRHTRPGTRGIAIDWTAWGDIGMATRGSIPKMMEAAGIDMLKAASGVPVIRRELTAGGTAGEIVIAGRLGALEQEWDEAGGLDTAAVAAAGPLVGSVRAFRLHGGLEVETTLDPKAQPFLDDHRIDGTPVLPGVMGIESFAEASTLVLPGWHILAVERIDFHAPFKFYRDEPRALTVTAVFRPSGDTVVADCRLTGIRTLAGQAEPRVTLHFTARVRLAPEARPEKLEGARPVRAERELSPEEIYRVYFHGPALRVVERAWRSNGEAVGLFSDSLPPDHQPAEQPTLVTPRLIELCFQTAGLLEMGTRGTMGLPLHVERVRLLREPTETSRLFAVVRPASAGFEARVVDEEGHVYIALEGYRTEELPGAVDEERLRSFRDVMSGDGKSADTPAYAGA